MFLGRDTNAEKNSFVYEKVGINNFERKCASLIRILLT